MNHSTKSTLWLLAFYAVSMALLEAVVVVYMRRLYYPDRPLLLFPLEFLKQYDLIAELARELSTIMMIVTVALLAERRTPTRCFAAFVFVFGLWDLFYYIWLKVLIGWPQTWLEWDVLFLIPGLWLGPWICPAVIAVLFVVWGSWGLQTKQDPVFAKGGVWVFTAGAVLGLLAFLQPAAAVVMAEGQEALSQYMPGDFWWWLFIPSGLMMAAGFATSIPARSADAPAIEQAF